MTELLMVLEQTVTETENMAENEDKPETPVIKTILIAARCKMK